MYLLFFQSVFTWFIDIIQNKLMDTQVQHVKYLPKIKQHLRHLSAAYRIKLMCGGFKNMTIVLTSKKDHIGQQSISLSRKEANNIQKAQGAPRLLHLHGMISLLRLKSHKNYCAENSKYIYWTYHTFLFSFYFAMLSCVN